LHPLDVMLGLETGMKIKRTFAVEITVTAELTQEEYDEAPPLTEWENEIKNVIKQELMHTQEDGVTFGLEITSKEDVSD
jgi:hypothetical protein